MKRRSGRAQVVALLWDPHRPTDPAPPVAAVDTKIFGATSSVRDYYLQVSGNAFTIERAGVLGWFDASRPPDYWWGPPDTNDSDHDGWVNPHVQKWAEAIRFADASVQLQGVRRQPARRRAASGRARRARRDSAEWTIRQQPRRRRPRVPEPACRSWSMASRFRRRGGLHRRAAEPRRRRARTRPSALEPAGSVFRSPDDRHVGGHPVRQSVCGGRLLPDGCDLQQRAFLPVSQAQTGLAPAAADPAGRALRAARDRARARSLDPAASARAARASTSSSKIGFRTTPTT